MTKSEAQSLRQTIPFTPEQLAEMAAMYGEVKSLRKVGKRFGINVNAVRSRLAAQGVSILPFVKQKSLTMDQIRLIVDEMCAGGNSLDLAAKYGVHDSTIRKYVVRYRAK